MMKSSDMCLGKSKKFLTLCAASLLLATQAGWAQNADENNEEADAEQFSVMDNRPVMDNRGESRNEQPADVGNEPSQLEDDMASETAAQDPGSDQQSGQDSQQQQSEQLEEGNTQAVAAQAFQGVSVDQLQGRPVTNLQGDEVGQVQDVVVSQQGNSAALVVSTGGFMGLGGKEVVLDSNQVQVEQNEIVWQSNQDSKALEQLPEYNEQNYVTVR